ncbi:hypothetical protein MTO96_020879, partial [Rhipicephalus appendiculatus]
RPQQPFASLILRCTVVLEPRVRLPSVESFHDACHRYLAASTQAIEAPTSRTEICQQSLLLGTTRRERKKLKSSFSGRAASRQGPHTSPLASSSSSTRANLPELFALLTMQQEADQDEHQLDDSEDPTEPSVSRRRGGPLTTSSVRKPRTECEARLRYRHRVASGLRARKRSGESLPKSSLEGERGRLERVAGVEGSHGSQRCRHAWKARGVCRREGRLTGGVRPAGESAWRVRLGVRLDLLTTSTPFVDWRRGLRGTTEDLCWFVVSRRSDDDDEDDRSCSRPRRGRSQTAGSSVASFSDTERSVRGGSWMV